MSFDPKAIDRVNDLYPRRDVWAVNNVGSDLNEGDIVILDWTSEGDANSAINGSANAMTATHIKAVVLKQLQEPNPSVLRSAQTGRFRIQGPCLVAVATGNAFTKGDPIFLKVATNGTNGANTRIATVAAPGTNNTYIDFTLGASLATTASLGTAQTMLCFFDGTNLNALYMKD